jgi:hypothetical protein
MFHQANILTLTVEIVLRANQRHGPQNILKKIGDDFCKIIEFLLKEPLFQAKPEKDLGKISLREQNLQRISFVLQFALESGYFKNMYTFNPQEIKTHKHFAVVCNEMNILYEHEKNSIEQQQKDLLVFYAAEAATRQKMGEEQQGMREQIEIEKLGFEMQIAYNQEKIHNE